MAETSIGVSEKTKAKLDSLKIHPRETYEEVIIRLTQAQEIKPLQANPKSVKQ